jgi:VWFA-related protein
MAHLVRYYVAAALTSTLSLTSVPTAAAQEPARPQFRAGVSVTRLEVTVLDKRTRTPVTGLTANDFVIKVNGDRQPVVSLAEVVLPASVAAPALAEAARDVSTNTRRPSRLFVLVLDDATGRTPFHRSTVKAIAHDFIDRIGPDDLAAVLFVCDNSEAQDFSPDRTLLRRAVEHYSVNGCPQPALRVVRRAQEFLLSMPSYRRAIVFVSPSLRGYSGTSLHQQDIAFAARFDHVPIYAFSAHGLRAPTAKDLTPDRVGRGGNPFREYDDHVESLRTLASVTRGRATVHTNAPADAVPAVFEELSSYYAVAYEHTYPDDGRLRRLSVEVTRPDAVVVSSRTLVRAPDAGADARLPGAGRASGLIEAMGEPLPSGDLPLRMASLPLAVPDAREQALALALTLPPAVVPEDYRMQLLIFDGEGRRQLSSQTLDVAVPAGVGNADDGGPEVALRLDLRPGRYNLRLVAERQRDGTAGSIHATVVVPDFARDALSLSGVAIGRADGHPIANRTALDGLLPISPTAIRDFLVTDRVIAFLRVHQSSRRPPRPVVLETEIVDTTGTVRWSAARTLAAGAFEPRAAAEHRFDLPLSELGAGSYLLRFVATAGDARTQRDVRFEVR